jgi:hypothetical protein
MDKTDFEKLPKKSLLPGYESGRYEPARHYDHTEFREELRGELDSEPTGESRAAFRGELRKPPLPDPIRRDNRVSVRISGQDMSKLHHLALTEGVPLQSLIASIVHRYVSALEGGKHVGANSSLPPLSHPVDSTPSAQASLQPGAGNSADQV